MSREKLIIDFIKSLNFKSSYQCPSAWIGHEKLANFLVKTCKPKTIVELGVHSGFSYFSFCQTVHDYKLETKCFGIDNWKGDFHQGFYDEKIYEEALEQNKKYHYFSELIRKDFNSASTNFKDHSIDFLHIDGYHTYDAVKSDFTNWLPKCTKDALILFHDVNEFRNDFGVYKLFNELKQSYSHFMSSHAHGLGIITLSNNKDNIINFLNTFDIQTNFSALLQDQDTELLKKTELYQNLTERESQIASLNQNLTEREGQIASLNQNLTERESQIASLNQVLVSKDQQLEDAHKDYLNSRSWRITSPLRSINKFITLRSINKFITLRSINKFITKFISTLNFIFLKKKNNKIFNFKKNLIKTSINTNSNVGEYVTEILSIADYNSGGLNINFVPRSKINYDLSSNPLKAIAFYLPQFHPIPENDKWWGKGFTEWTNVSKSMPQFTGHYQPHLPGDLGFYDLRLVEVQSLQIEIAKQYGIYGFCYHYYWFNGKRLLQKPFEQFLSNKNLDFPFCLCWANENWTRKWDGKEDDILINQNHSPEDDINFISNITPALRDSRYIRFNKKPIIIVYRTTLMPDPKATALRWREYCLKNGVGEIYLIAARSFEFKDPVSIGFDASIEFPPHEANSKVLNDEINFINSKFQGKVYDFSDLANSYLKISSDKYPILKTVCPGWDNSARKPGKGHIFYGSGTVAYSRWLRGACEQTIKSAVINKNHPPFIFINAWNEWAEGAHLEPDRKYGFANLHSTANILQSFTPLKAEIENEINNSQNNFKKTSNGAVVLHFFYGDLLEEFLPYLERVKNLDLFVSLGPNITLEQIDQLKKNFPNLYLVAFQNKGRDVMSFIKILKVLEKFKYQYGCKIHTKKSPQFSYGGKLRRNMLESLLGSENEVKKFIKMFTGNINTGLMAPAEMFSDLSDLNKNIANRFWLDKLLIKMGKSNLIGKYSWQFVAGTAFWFRVDSLNFLSSLNLSDNDFEEELGQLDGTLAHAIERIIPLGIVQSGYSILKK
jgi:lipopolysaccharide biosynthesis protein